MERLLENYKKRVDISKKWISNFTNQADGRQFDRTHFFPKAYLDIQKTYSKAFSFANTKGFIKNEENWKKLNGYNRNTKDKERHKFNKIARELENGFINYDNALIKVKSITNKTDEYIKQLNARYFGMYKNMNV